MFGATVSYLSITICSYHGITGDTVTALAFVAKLFGSTAWFVMWVQCVELFPTAVRAAGTNFSSVTSNITCLVVPYVMLIGNTNLPLMYGIFVVVAGIGTIAASMVPETFKYPLPECIKDIEDRQKCPYFSWKTAFGEIVSKL